MTANPETFDWLDLLATPPSPEPWPRAEPGENDEPWLLRQEDTPDSNTESSGAPPENLHWWDLKHKKEEFKEKRKFQETHPVPAVQAKNISTVTERFN